MSHSRNSTQAPDSTGPELADTLLSDFLVDTEAMLRALQADGVSAAALTAAESRVLQFLPSRLTFQQIGKHLFLFQTTIKTMHGPSTANSAPPPATGR